MYRELRQNQYVPKISSWPTMAVRGYQDSPISSPAVTYRSFHGIYAQVRHSPPTEITVEVFVERFLGLQPAQEQIYQITVSDIYAVAAHKSHLLDSITSYQ